MIRLVGLFGLMLVFCACAQSPEPEHFDPPQPATEAEQATDDDMARVLQLWREYEMPSPPEDAELVWIAERQTRTTVPAGFTPRGYYAFLLDKDSQFARLHDGTMEFRRRYSEILPPEIYPTDRHLIISRWPLLYRYPGEFPIGLHAYKRGQHELGRMLITRALDLQYVTVRDSYRMPRGETVHDMLGAVIWGYWFNQAMEAGTDRRAIHQSPEFLDSQRRVVS
jgi:hypothetical protein